MGKIDIEQLLLDEFTPHVYNDINQAGKEMLVIDLDDLNSCIGNIVEKLKQEGVGIPCSGCRCS